MNINKLYLLGCLLLAATTAQASETPNIQASEKRLSFTSTARATDITLDANIQMQTIIYLSLWSVSPRLAIPISDKLSVGVGSNFGIASSPFMNNSALMLSGGPVITYGSESAFFNVGLQYFGFREIGDEDRTRTLMTSVGGGIRIASKSMVYAEVNFIRELWNNASDSTTNTTVGFRFGNRIYADISIFTLFDDHTELQPMPMLTIGFGF